MASINKALLQQVYSETNKSGLQVARELGIGRTTLSRYLKKFGLREKKIAEVMKGKKLSPEHRAKVIKTLRYGLFGENNPNWKKGRTIKSTKEKRGYVWLRMPDHPKAMSNGYYPEHRYIMENKIGRTLNHFEHVHHINGIKDDNRIENLELVNGQTHNLITRMESRIRELEEENRKLKKLLLVN